MQSQGGGRVFGQVSCGVTPAVLKATLRLPLGAELQARLSANQGWAGGRDEVRGFPILEL